LDTFFFPAANISVRISLNTSRQQMSSVQWCSGVYFAEDSLVILCRKINGKVRHNGVLYSLFDLPNAS